MVVSKQGMRGLSMFIAEIRNCRSKEDEMKRVYKEFSNIRDKFSNSQTLNSYDKRKYICKLLFIFLLGYDVDFGFQEAVSLILSNKFIDKKIAFLFLSTMVSPENASMKLIHKSIKSELESTYPLFQMVALEAITNMASSSMASEFAYAVMQILISPRSEDSNKQCAAICLLTLFRVNSQEMEHLTGNEQWRSQLIQLLYHSNLSLMSAAASLLTYLSSSDPSSFIDIISPTISRIVKIIDSSGTDQLPDLKYYQVTAPFITVKLLKLLQTQPDLQSVESDLRHVMDKINSQALNYVGKKTQHINASHALFFEAANLSVHSGMVDMCLLYLPHLTEMLKWEHANYRHCALVILTSMTSIPKVFEELRKSKEVIINVLKTDPDSNVKRTSVSLLCAMCTRSDVTSIVAELIDYLKVASLDIREDLALKIPFLCERFISDSKWYVETILSLMITDGELVGEEICNRVINIIMRKTELQKYSVNILLNALGSNYLHDNLLMMSAYIIGEYGQYSLLEPEKLIKTLHSKFFLCSRRTQNLMLSAYGKLCSIYPAISSLTLEILGDVNIWRSSDVEVQNRAYEYSCIIKSNNQKLINDVFEEMPPYIKKEDDNSSSHSLFEDNLENVENTLFNSPNTSFVSGEHMDSLLLKKQFLTNDSGLIFDGTDLSVSLQVKKNADQPARISVFLTLASKGSEIDKINLTIPNIPSDIPVKIEVSSPSNSILPWGQMTYHLYITCLSMFFVDLPPLNLEYECHLRTSKTLLTLPITITKFIVDQKINANLFSTRWSKIPAANVCQKVVVPETNGFLLYSKIGNLGISHLPNIDQNPNVFMGSALFTSHNNLVGLLMRIEPIDEHSSNKVKITTKFTTPSAELFNGLCSLIEIL